MSRTMSLGPQEMGSHDDHMTPSDQSDSNPPSQGEVTWIRRSYSDSLIVIDSRRRPRPLEALLVKEPSETTFLDHQYNGEDAGEEGESEVDREGSKDNRGYLFERSAPIVIQVCVWGLCVSGFESRVQGLHYAGCRDGLQMCVHSFTHIAWAIDFTTWVYPAHCAYSEQWCVYCLKRLVWPPLENKAWVRG